MNIKRLAQATAAAIALMMGAHTLAMPALFNAAHVQMAMEQTGQHLPANCATLCLMGLHQMEITGIPTELQMLMMVAAILIGIANLQLLVTTVQDPKITLRRKPPDLLKTYGAYRI